MITIISPAKNIDTEWKSINPERTLPEFLETANDLAAQLKLLSVDDLRDLFQVNANIAGLNHHRYQIWQYNGDTKKQQAAIHLFNGEVYRGLQAHSLSKAQLSFATDNLRILSGLYGILKPLDSIQPYRLEMGMRWGGIDHPSLYSVWTAKVTQSLNNAMLQSKGDKVLVHLASEEYFKVIDKNKFGYPVLLIDFKQMVNGKPKNITVYSKRARGLMARFIIDNKIGKTEHLKAFTDEGYYMSAEHSSDNKWVFVR